MERRHHVTVYRLHVERPCSILEYIVSAYVYWDTRLLFCMPD